MVKCIIWLKLVNFKNIRFKIFLSRKKTEVWWRKRCDGASTEETLIWMLVDWKMWFDVFNVNICLK